MPSPTSKPTECKQRIVQPLGCRRVSVFKAVLTWTIRRQLVLLQTRFLTCLYWGAHAGRQLENQRLSAVVVTGNRAEKCLYFDFATEPVLDEGIKDRT
jgi:hypothetical protein